MRLVEAARADHESCARAVAGADEDMLGAYRAVQEVPLAQRALLAVDDRGAVAVQDQEVFLDRLAVVGQFGWRRCMIWMFTPVSGDGAFSDSESTVIARPGRPWAGASATLTMNGVSTSCVLA